ncbi:MAG TPA: hypothetical protein VM221_13645 [Armatimonadota bacterium]|nr:hypothetical protein [Armatimonadota bacterium]
MSSDDRRVDSAATAPAQAGPPISAAELDRRRTVYYVLILAQIPVAVAARAVHTPALSVVLGILLLVWLIAFLWVFLGTARLAGMSVPALVPIAVLVLIPLIGIITVMVVDFHIADTVDRGPGQEDTPRLSRLSYWSLIMAWLPMVGLPMAAVALWQIGARRGRLTGRGLAIAGLVVNTLFAMLWVAVIVAINIPRG